MLFANRAQAFRRTGGFGNRRRARHRPRHSNVGQYQFYFNFYPTVDRWPVPTYEGNAVNDQGKTHWLRRLAGVSIW